MPLSIYDVGAVLGIILPALVLTALVLREICGARNKEE